MDLIDWQAFILALGVTLFIGAFIAFVLEDL